MTEESQPMSNQGKKEETLSHNEFVQHTMDEFLSKADVNTVYGPPVHKDDLLIIPAAEVLAVAGVGAGEGMGPKDQGGGSGSGGGGRAFSRPVAVIIAGPDGVRIEPILDITKIGLAALTTAGFMLATMMRLRFPRRHREG